MAAGDLSKLPLIVIAGPTASGKTGLAVELAERYNGEIICADSRTVYKYMDIGTAKPTKAERARVQHWGLDLVEPDQSFSAAEFKVYANTKISEIRARGRVPFLVGGTGLYVDSVIFDYQFGVKSDLERRNQLNELPISELIEYCNINNIELPKNPRNKRHLVRAIEQNGINNRRRETPISNSTIVGISTEKVELQSRIRQRAEQLLANGVVEEATILGKKYGWDRPAMTSNIYPLVKQFICNHVTSDELIDKSTTLDWQLAKRQLTWLRRNPHINWMSLGGARKYIIDILANEQ